MRALATKVFSWLRKVFPPTYEGDPVCMDWQAASSVQQPLACHAGNIGDVIFGCLFLKSFWQHTAKAVSLHLTTDVPVNYSVPHPLKNVLMNRKMAEQLLPLLAWQPYIDSLDISPITPQDVHFNLNVFRTLPMSLRCGLIQGWQQLCSDIWLNPFEPWLQVPTDTRFASTIVVARTARLRSPYIDYGFLKQWKGDLLFVGLDEEFLQFQNESQIDCAHYVADSFDQLATIIASCRLFIGNQGFPYTLAEAVKAPRVLESNPIAPNNFPLSPNGRIALFQRQFESFVHTMLSPQ